MEFRRDLQSGSAFNAARNRAFAQPRAQRRADREGRAPDTKTLEVRLSKSRLSYSWQNGRD